jgi:hypothetical protein
MIAKKIYFQENQEDTIQDSLNRGETVLFNESSWLKSNLLSQLKGFSLSLPVLDLVNLAVFVYTIDQTVSRTTNGYLGWSRHLQCSFPVTDLDKWNGVKKKIEDLLSFLSGDKWAFEFRRKKVAIEDSYEPTNPKGLTKVCLFSGGLDSLIGAIDLVENDEKVALISHYKNGSSEHKAQQRLYSILQKDKVEHFPFYVQPNQKNEYASKEGSSRARSFLFIVLGVAVSDSLGGLPLIIPENGLISLNIPLTYTRLGSHSTRTTHPYYLKLLGEVLKELGLKTTLFNPYLYYTKGEMVENCKNRQLLEQVYKQSISCSHPDVSRFKKQSPGKNCGYCVPCLIRRASLKRAGLEDVYLVDVVANPPSSFKKSGSDYQSFMLALKHLKDLKPHHIPLHISSAGSLSFLGSSNLQKLSEMYLRGMKEVEDIFI